MLTFDIPSLIANRTEDDLCLDDRIEELRIVQTFTGRGDPSQFRVHGCVDGKFHEVSFCASCNVKGVTDE